MTKPAAALDRRLAVLLAIVCGAGAANIYYAQPILHAIADSLGTTQAAAGLLVTATQVAYALGLVLLVPLGDVMERRGLIVRMLLACAVALIAAGAAPSITALTVALTAVGATAVVGQAIVALASDLAADEERGRVVGIVMSGLLIGILVARTLSGALAEIAGWRAPFFTAAVLMLLSAGALRVALPRRPSHAAHGYGALLRSIATLVREEPVLRVRMAYGAVGMATFSVLWTSLSFLLAGPAYGFGEATIGLFGLAGLAGAIGAQGAGRLSDRGHGRKVTGASSLAMVAAWALCAAGESSVGALIAGIVLLDAGVMAQHISNQSVIYALRPDARSRITTAYMTSFFLFGAAGSGLATAAWLAGGWMAVSLLGSGIAACGLLLWVAEPRLTARAAAQPDRG
jgi:predicted MFS family arabinose efflux permease